MTQVILVSMLFAAAAFWIGRRVYHTLQGKSQEGCDKCPANGPSRRASGSDH